MKDDTVRRLQALEDELTFPAEPAGEDRAESADEFAAEFAALVYSGDAA